MRLSERWFTGKRLPLMVAFAFLLVAAFGVGCGNFFSDPTLSSIAIQPPSPQVQVDHTTTVQAWGTYSDNTRKQITSGVSWTSSDQSIQITGSCATQPCGAVTITGTGNGGTSTLTAAAQGLSATATATAFLGTVTGFKACQGTFSSTSCPNPAWTVGQSGGTNTFNAQATSNGQQIDLTTQSTWTPSTSSITCTSTSTPATCAVSSNTPANTYTITVTYGTNDSFIFDVTVTNP